MKQDMHYYGIGFLARAAGLPKKDALTIAYASQYVDDSTESTPMDCGDFYFDPVRTAHNGLGAVSWTVQRKIHMPFHFLPAQPLTSKPDAFVTKPNSAMAKSVLDRALSENDREKKMIALGIAMHTYADTWAHKGFVGKEDDLNDVETIRYKEDGKWINPILENVVLDILPCIGHAQASSYPDLPWIEWKYHNDGTGKDVRRKNHELFLDAAKNIHAYFCQMPEATGTIIAWTSMVQEIMDVLATVDTRLEIRIQKWNALYKKYFKNTHGYLYHHRIWRNQAFDQRYEGRSDWDTLTRDAIAAKTYKPKGNFWNTRWVKYHQMALKQRHFVLEELW